MLMLQKKDLEKISAQVANLLKGERIPQNVINQVTYRLSVDNPTTPWWVVVLKVLAYAIGLILAGVGTTATAATLFIH